MRMVIDIPDDTTKLIKECIKFDNMVDLDVYDIVLNGIKNGIPLPKGHGDLIDRGKTVKRICKIAEFMNEKRENLGSPYIMAALFIQDNKEEFPTIIGADKEANNGCND